MICPACHKDVQPIDDLGTDMRLTKRCPIATCSAAFPTAPPPQASTPRPAKERQEAKPATGQLDVLGLAKARLVALEGELAALEAKRTEAAMLRRMIWAAEASETNHDHLDA